MPRDQREALIAEFERSGLRGTQFARAAGINYGTFASWMQDRRHARGDYVRGDRRACPAPVAPLRLMEVVPAAASAVLPQAAGTSLEVLLPGGARVFVADARQAALAAHLLNNLRVSC